MATVEQLSWSREQAAETASSIAGLVFEFDEGVSADGSESLPESDCAVGPHPRFVADIDHSGGRSRTERGELGARVPRVVIEDVRKLTGLQ
ncbi:hypothetical protein [Amycolatopsis alba]|uniref:Uncharacterized protein n=1 Tax=Amycolatopsis alba DSM 44262 TaxID=1125972 RepID=A0A229RAU9_AMYAL|nr:hypothetical protein [Amycolatopsis alba]OXM43793.1 hypothetical protein CFP75_37090 [Amycolatopsis alba DSM 44262]